jgi:hypothetical protein
MESVTAERTLSAMTLVTPVFFTTWSKSSVFFRDCKYKRCVCYLSSKWQRISRRDRSFLQCSPPSFRLGNQHPRSLGTLSPHKHVPSRPWWRTEHDGELRAQRCGRRQRQCTPTRLRPEERRKTTGEAW